MPFLPHTASDIAAMLEVIGAASVEELFDEIPPELRLAEPPDFPEALNEMQVMRLMRERAARDEGLLCFIGAGAYEHHIPAAVWQIAARGEFLTAYTPYQAEASQGTLRVLYEFQSMMAGLLGLEVANASLYDGASALAEAILMAVRVHGKGNRVLIPAALHPRYRQVVRTLTRPQGIELIELPYCAELGQTMPQALIRHGGSGVAAVVIAQPNFFGVLEEVDQQVDWAHEQGAVAVGVVNPVSLGLLKPPGEWGARGVEIACGEGQPLGAPLAGGGPYFGFIACRGGLARQLPGRIAGRTADRAGGTGFVLTLQAREQHIRRARATSNICTNQGLLTVAAAIHLALLGPEGLGRVAGSCHANLNTLLAYLEHVGGVEPLFTGPRFHEVVLRLPAAVERVVEGLAERGFAGGYPLKRDYPELGDALLVCTTETREVGDLALYATALADTLEELGC